jgi:SAM-dependent methyltransferase
VYAEPGSFRDRDNQVLYDDSGGVLRALRGDGLDDWAALSASRLFAEFSADGQLVGTEAEGEELLRHERIPFISYPYEWTFSMLKDAALLELDLVLAGLDEGLILKDGTPYNVQWRGARPVFIDIGSFERLREGEPWAGYRQFCMQFLYPLLIQAYRGLPFQPWLRGSLEGIEPAACRRLLSGRDLFRRGVFTHVVLHQRLERQHGSHGGDTRHELQEAGFGTQMIRANVTRLRKLVERLGPREATSAWSGYADDNTYSEVEAGRKEEFVRAAVRAARPELVWDVGCNDGRYSRIAAEHAGYTLALDADERTLDRLYGELAAEEHGSIVPLVVDVADPSPALGWCNLERKELADRGKPDLVLCLALVHHLAITRNIPIASFVRWLRSLDAAVVVEFPTAEDTQVRRLLDAKRPGSHDDYDLPAFEAVLAEHFAIDRREQIAATRVAFFAYPQR